MSDELPSAPPVEAPPRRLGVGFGIGMSVFVVLGGVVSMFLMLPLGMASDPCGQGSTEFRCSLTGQQLLPWLPWIGWVAGLIVAGIGAALLRRWEAAPASGLFGAGVVYVVTVVIALGYAGGGDAPQPPPVTQQQINADYQKLMRRPDAETMVGQYKTLIPEIESQLGPGVQWDSVIDEGGQQCGSDFAAIASVAPYTSTDAQIFYLSVPGTSSLDPPGWQRASDALTAYLTAHGFTEDPNTDDDPYFLGTSFHDRYGTEVNLGTEPATAKQPAQSMTMNVGTGCFLSAAAKQRGTPPTGP
ncbi:MAG TPA: LppA family lipoprotein [Pseudonocardiaceae bacterium]|jgi:hypothetical protein|nr:LppA family lipoprotein [Pseudonocardiaceae bacterium]